MRMSLVAPYIAATLAASVFLSACEYMLPNRGISVLYAVSPSLIAFAFAARDPERPLKSLGWRPNFRYWLVVTGFIVSMVVILLCVAWLFGDFHLNEKALRKFLRLSTVVGLVVGIAVNTGEEAGWRGYLFPKLYEERGWWPAILVSAFVWWAWHVPFMAVLQIRQFGEVQWNTQFIHLLSLFPGSVLCSYCYLRSGSFWAVGFAHQLGNFVNKWFLGLEHSAKHPIFFQDQSLAHLYSLENGIFGLVLLYMAAGALYLRYRHWLTGGNPVERKAKQGEAKG